MWDLKITALLREGKGPGESSAESGALPISAQFSHLKQQILNLIAHVLMLTPAETETWVLCIPIQSGQKSNQE